MAETLKRHRETAAWLVLGISMLYIGMSLVRWGYSLYQRGAFTTATRAIGGSSLSVPMVLACLAAALACALVRPPSPNARRIVRVAAMVVTAAGVLQAFFLVVGLFGAPRGVFGMVFEVLGGVLEIGIKALVATLLWRAAGSTAEPERPAAVEPAPSTAVVQAQPEPEKRRASWDADEAVGAVWTRAGDAASGAAASGWGRPGKHSGWDAGQPALGTEATPELSAQGSSQQQPVRGPWATAGELAAQPDRVDEADRVDEYRADESDRADGATSAQLTDNPNNSGQDHRQGPPEQGTGRGGWEPAKRS